MLMANNGTTGFFRMQPDSSTSGISIPSASLPLSTALALWNSLTAGMILSAQFLPYTLPTGAQHPHIHLKQCFLTTMGTFRYKTYSCIRTSVDLPASWGSRCGRCHFGSQSLPPPSEIHGCVHGMQTALRAWPSFLPMVQRWMAALSQTSSPRGPQYPQVAHGEQVTIL